jgi:tetratricopeptide (TPR) repeat protein
MMSERARSLFVEIAPLPGDERASRLAGASGLNGEESAEIRRLLEALDFSPGFLDSPMLAWNAQSASIAESAVLCWLASGDRIGTYTIGCEVGRGGMGVVYKATQDSPRRRVALKVMKPGPRSRTDLTRFRREAEILGRLSHPNIAAVFEARTIECGGGSLEEIPFIAMEFVDGVPITEFAAVRGLDAAARVALIESAADALHHAHEQNVLHRDVSPSNILVDGTGRVKVVDFGVARLSEAGRAASLATGGDGVLGKWAYASPEQADGDAARVGRSSDIFSLGAVLYELLAGRPWLAVEGRTVFELLRAIRDSSPAALPPMRCPREKDLRAIIETAMHRRPARRYPSAGEFRDDLRRWRTSRRVVVRRPGVPERACGFAASHRVLTASAGAAFAAVSIGLAVATTQWIRAREAESRMRETVRTVLENVVAATNRTRMSIEVRAGALREVRPAIEGLLAASPGDPEVRTLAANYHIEVAKMDGYDYTVSRGDRTGAIERFRRAVRVAAPEGIGRVTSEPAAFAALEALNFLEEMQHMGGLLTAADEQALLDAIALCDRRLARGASPLRWAWYRVWTGGNLMSRYAATERTELIPPIRERSLAILSEASARVATPEDHRLVGETWLSFANHSTRAGRCEGVPHACLRAREFLEVWLARTDADPDERLDLLDTYRYASTCLARLGRLDEALASAEEATGYARRLTDQFPERHNVWSGLLVALRELGLVRSSLGRADALEPIDEAIRVAESSVTESLTPKQFSRRMADFHLNRAMTARALEGAGLSMDRSGRALAAVAGESLDRAEALASTIESPEADEILAEIGRLRGR